MVILQISALKQNGLLQTLAAGGDQPKPAGDTHIVSDNLSFVSHPLPTGICECILDTSQLLQVEPPSGVQFVCMEVEWGLSGALDDVGLLDRKDL